MGPIPHTRSSDYRFDMNRYLGRGWELCNEKLGLHMLLTAAWMAIIVFPAYMPELFYLSILLFPLPLYLMLRLVIASDQTLPEGLKTSKSIVPMLLIMLLLPLAAGLSSLLLIPGIIAFTASSYFIILFMLIPSAGLKSILSSGLKTSWKNFRYYFLLSLILLTLNVCGLMIAGFGILITVPFTFSVFYAAVKHLGFMPLLEEHPAINEKIRPELRPDQISSSKQLLPGELHN